MISVVTMTYRRGRLLEEAIQSYVLNADCNTEMVIVNDYGLVRYYLPQRFCEAYNIRIINLPERFDHVGQKLRYAFKQCKYKHIYRLDDDDLLAENSLSRLQKDIQTNPAYDIYRSKYSYYCLDFKNAGVLDSVNNGNVFSYHYLSNIFDDDGWNCSVGEDKWLVLENNAKVYEVLYPSMIYRWGMNTYHISNAGLSTRNMVYAHADEAFDLDLGKVNLRPRFNNDYYNMFRNVE